MNRKLGLFAVAVTVLSAAACNDGGSVSDAASNPNSVLASFDYTPTGFSSTQNSFMGADSAWGAHGEDHYGERGGPHGDRNSRGPGMMGMGPGMRGFGPGGFGIAGLMGGGLEGRFRGEGYGPRTPQCPASREHDNLTITCTITFQDAAGNTQSAWDNVTTNTVNTKISVTGSITRRDSSVTTVSNSSDRTVSGLADGSTTRTINGTATGTEQTAGKDTAGTFTVKRVAGDTVKAVVIPVRASTDVVPAYPTSGTVTRTSSITVTRASGTTSSTRREVIIYDGSSTAKVTITQDGTTKSCTVALPHGKLQCS